MAFVVGPSRKPGFWAEVERLNRVAAKGEKKAAPVEAHKKPPKVMQKASDVHKKAGKASKPAARKKGRK